MNPAADPLSIGAGTSSADADVCTPNEDDIRRLTRALQRGERVSPQPALRTRRLHLQPPGFCHLDDLLHLDAAPGVSRLLIDAVATDRIQAAGLVVLASHTAREHPGLGLWHSCDEHGRFIGTFSLMPTPGGEVEIGARLMPAAWGHFYAVEGGRALVQHALHTLHLPQLLGLAHPDNRAAAAVLRRLGFVADGHCQHLQVPAQRWRLQNPVDNRKARSQ